MQRPVKGRGDLRAFEVVVILRHIAKQQFPFGDVGSIEVGIKQIADFRSVILGSLERGRFLLWCGRLGLRARCKKI